MCYNVRTWLLRRADLQIPETPQTAPWWQSARILEGVWPDGLWEMLQGGFHHPHGLWAQDRRPGNLNPEKRPRLVSKQSLNQGRSGRVWQGRSRDSQVRAERAESEGRSRETPVVPANSATNSHEGPATVPWEELSTGPGDVRTGLLGALHGPEKAHFIHTRTYKPGTKI